MGFDSFGQQEEWTGKAAETDGENRGFQIPDVITNVKQGHELFRHAYVRCTM